MRRMRKRDILLSGCVLLGSGIAATAAQPSVENMLRFRPRQPDVDIATPSGADLAGCKVELARGPGRGSAWVLKDTNGATLRRFADSKGGGYPDHMCYYKDGMEVYRELDTNGNKVADEYRWLNTAGMKIGVDANEDGKIESWKALSVEELSQEVLKSLIAKDYSRFEMLMVSDNDLRTIAAPLSEVNRIQSLQKQSARKFIQTADKMSHLDGSTKWLRIETGPPSRLPGDTTGMKSDVLMYYRAVILCETSEKHDWIQLGEIVRVDDAWKLIDAPMPTGAAAPAVGNFAAEDGDEPATGIDPAVQPLVDQIAKLDAQAPSANMGGPNPAIVRHYLRRADIIDQIIVQSKPDARELWYKQLGDSLSAAVQAGSSSDQAPLSRLSRLADQIERSMPGSEVAAYIVFREINAAHAQRTAALNKPEDIVPAQNEFQAKLADYANKYPKAEDTPDALLQLAMNSEFQAKEDEAKKWYQKLIQVAPESQQGVKAAGALRRMNLEGSDWELNAPVANLAGGPFRLDMLRGKTTIVYYWATMCPTAAADFEHLAEFAKMNASRNIQVVGINMDDDRNEAEAFIRKLRPIGHHLHGGGLESPIATHYGLVIFPNIFIIGPDGKVISRTAQIGTLDAELSQDEGK